MVACTLFPVLISDFTEIVPGPFSVLRWVLWISLIFANLLSYWGHGILSLLGNPTVCSSSSLQFHILYRGDMVLYLSQP